MKQALGLVEIQGLSTAVVVADTMSKAANVHILDVENTKGLGYMTIKIAGDVGAVNAAVNAGCQVGRINGKLVSWKVIPRPSDYVGDLFCNETPPTPPEPTSSPENETAEQAEPVPEVTEAAPEPSAEEKQAKPKAAKTKAPAKRKIAARAKKEQLLEKKKQVEEGGAEDVIRAEAAPETEAAEVTETPEAETAEVAVAPTAEAPEETGEISEQPKE